MGVGIPLFVGLIVAAILYLTIHWWGFLIIFPWIGLSISAGMFLERYLAKSSLDLGRRIAILMILPVFILFIPLANRENLQIEGVILLLSIGYFSKGVIHYAVAKVFGPLIWGRGFCGWACWTAAVLDWLPIAKKGVIPSKWKNLRYVSLFVSVLIPLTFVFFLNYDVRRDYLSHQEPYWMFAGVALYYLLGLSVAYWFQDRRAFCKVLCPVALVMKPSASISLLARKPTGVKCIRCGRCNNACPMDVDIVGCMMEGKPVRDSECTLCNACVRACPVGAIR
ncbi:4Fe-4S dicluster domain-containing protein [Heliobacterium undosum]|uniref:4Fe-4S dicluster domain-containing protein n=1 Tax=Heliomicrobium undosum TaxID=121734 RepID=A0A845LEV8_9FIRM|nr:4Fe-4S dicluster domain-containing protein [Heliomicrobium undosum]MZP31461.1 4Fe-4S dicluster domain-containing protein [Heliomicrobium undosum]